ncbi:tRNA (adenosine(37)-N6)-threonylcarbamoyltransferase complex ATPase subunit type 1 TsaE [Calidifontibacter sp. DB0510]|uniref:tRNA threonylcarbamoyladenosine biosynthesis protein TsaE n=1 Tax=Metallococcus carri TaxID=1656884 RepID=A0A967B343_9MICO|nr:tRNA (adenosine(37)-N6)-threonylcarbamoyltransferase complex ATPase subunit type 1 TsaE [Metallococcus carri]NHN56653.1 tRNA (adenosine(37)-N6)-threonylcarbamoyltransferase complex ATPase subunit type 1 TsaE [Metallococcus carri]NOP38952.1 tRNA (adenosine(37)-N6)-threonylcarbamoyltransferase complex ATPase subunit type 1 TsaE [Calidifontibacter sp. DB2511S]
MTEQVATDRAQTQDLGRRLGTVLRAGDVVILTGDLGAGKTTFTQGVAEGLRVRGPITSPTFVIARVHPSLADGPALVHVDAYRLGGSAELDDLDLDTSLEDSVTIIEWGSGIADVLADDHLEITLVADPASEHRRITLHANGPRSEQIVRELS